MYKIVYLDQVEDGLKKLDRSTVPKLFHRIETYLAQSPREWGSLSKQSFRDIGAIDGEMSG